jgi:hypothetical protein
MRVLFTLALAPVLAATGCATVPATFEPVPAPAQPAPPATADAIPTGSHLRAELREPIRVGTQRVGDRFALVVTDPLLAQDGQLVVPRGAVIGGAITGIGSEGEDVAAVRVAFDVIQIEGRTYAFDADVVHTRVPADPTRTRRAIEGAVVGAAAGAALGAIVRGGDLEGILVGGALGAGAGTIIALGTADGRAALPAGTVLTLSTTQPVELR